MSECPLKILSLGNINIELYCFGPCQFQIPVFCTPRGRRTLSIRFQERLAHIQRQRFATESGRDVRHSADSAEQSYSV